MTWRIEALAAHHARQQFSCGVPQLDDYLKALAGQHARKDYGRTFVAVRPGERAVLGYYTLASSSVAFAHAPLELQRKLPRYPIPVALLGKLAVDTSMQGKGLGEHLLMDAMHRVARVAGEIALFALEVHALNATAERFYKRYGFQPFLDQPGHLFLPLATIRALFQDP